ncbi:FAD:protein FMN transferase [Actinomadura rayongensis]|uniref:FAD:protein FMN transferase n=2 Tax=Actinomadura rayongensis TaxID=1429076 RepID=A0A6I4W915_9ACTN|nr:FAD:protein FMN transferase [Actinomadura rayongensis]MXQ65663.1 FAD:protein FMN transferase [Actinomadura rayongensis]
MGTVFSFDVRTPPTPRIRAALTNAVAWLHHVDAVFSPYRPDSQISHLRDRTLTLDKCDPDVQDILKFCAELSAETGGRFTASPGGRLDPSGAVKGWAIERASDLLFAAGAVDHCVNGGGDVQTRGEPEPGEPWRIGVADPRDRTRIAAVIEGRDIAVATSGTAERGPHILDPATGRPATALLSLTLAGRRLTRTDALATAAFAMGDEARTWLAARPDLHAYTVTAAGDVHATPAFTTHNGVPWLHL